MPNHVHLIALATAVGNTHQRYTRHINQREGWGGYLWQGRFASFPMDDGHLRACVRYVGLNPVRSGLAERAVDWRWSSVRAHIGGERPDPLLTLAPLQARLAEPMDQFFDIDVEEEALRKLRRASSSGCPLGAAAWIRSLEAATGRALVERPVGRPKLWTHTIFPVS
jgi:putative transposase